MSVSLQYCLAGQWHPLTEPSSFAKPKRNGNRLSKPLTIGLINNMPDAALGATERQFQNLLSSASGDIHVQLRFYSMTDIPRGQAAAGHIARSYAGVEHLWSDPVDALIVTGREPNSADLRNEPYWESFRRLVEWAQANTASTVWSCLAAHAAALHLDGVTRVRAIRKYCGVFDCKKATDHSLTAGTPEMIRLPHSRWNGLNESELIDSGYTILTRSDEAGVDTFVKHDRSLFVFFQGHPEYDPETLLLEYRRDAGRYLRGEVASYPNLPISYLDNATEHQLSQIAQAAQHSRRENLINEVSLLLQNISINHAWKSTATSIYSNWLQMLFKEKYPRLRPEVQHQSELSQGSSGAVRAIGQGADRASRQPALVC